MTNHATFVARAHDVFGRHNPIITNRSQRAWLDQVVFPQSKEQWGHLPVDQRLDHLWQCAMLGCLPSEPEPFRTWWQRFAEHDLPALAQAFLTRKT